MKRALVGFSAVPGMLMAADYDPGQRSPDSIESPMAYEEYRIQPGDTLYHIAQKKIGRAVGDRLGLKSLEFLLSHNKQIKNPNLVRVGQKVFIPSYQERKDFLVGSGDPRDFHIVNKGETLSFLALEWMGKPYFTSSYDGSLQLVIAANPQIKNPDVIEVGDLVFIPRQVKSFKHRTTNSTLRFHVPSHFVMTNNQIVSVDSDKFSVIKREAEDEGHLVFAGL